MPLWGGETAPRVVKGRKHILQQQARLRAQGGGLPIQTFSQFKHEQYRTITVVWALILVAAYCIALYRIPVQGNYAHWAMVLSLQMLCFTVAVASHKGSAKDLRTATFALWLLRTSWYGLFSVGMMSLSLGYLSSTSFQTSYPSLTSWTTVLFNIIAMVHLPQPALLLSIQALTLAMSCVRLGKLAFPSFVQSLVVHGACGVVNILLERRDRSCYTLMVQRERQARTRAHHIKGSSIGSTSSSSNSSDACRGAAGTTTAGDSCAARHASTPTELSSHASSPPMMSSIQSCDASLPSSGQASRCISCPISAVAPHCCSPHTDTSSLTASSPHLGSFSMLPIHASADVGVQAASDGMHTSNGGEMRARSEGVASLRSAVLAQWDASEARPEILRRVEQVSGRLRSRRPVYKQRYHKYQVVIKVPCAANPEDLSGSAIPRLVSIVQEQNPGCIVSNSATRSGCILIKLDLQSTKGAASASAGKKGALQALATAVQAWLQETELDAQLLGQKPVLLQVDDDVGEMVLDTGTCAWGMQPVGPLTQAALGFEEDYSIMVTPAVLMPHTPSPEDSQDPGHQHKEHSSSSGSSSSSAGSSKERSSGCLTIPVQSRVRVPAGVHIAGWSWRPSDLDGGMEAGVQVVEGSVNNRQLEQGKDDVALVQVLANVQGYGYTATCLAKVPPDSAGDCSSEGGDNKGCSYEVCVSVPELVAAHGWPRLLRLELWHGEALLSSSSSILLPACMPGAASELQSLPWGCEDTEDLADYITDLGHWLHKNRSGSVTPSSSDPAAQAEHDEEQQQQQQQQQRVPTPWEVGVSLLKQSVLWGLPSVCTLLVDTLMGGLPSAPADVPFARLAHTPVGDATAAAAGQQGAGQDGGGVDTQGMGGLLHLSLLCPHASSMLAAVLDWGRRWGSKEPGFAWGWNERSSIGFTPLDILSTLPKDSEVLQLLLGDPELAVVLLTAALQRARDRGAAPAPASVAGRAEHHTDEGVRGGRGSFLVPHGARRPVSAEGGALPAIPSIQGVSPNTATTATINSPSLSAPLLLGAQPIGDEPPAAAAPSSTTKCCPHGPAAPTLPLQQLSDLLLSYIPLKYGLHADNRVRIAEARGLRLKGLLASLSSLISAAGAASTATANCAAARVAHTFPTAAAAAVVAATSRLLHSTSSCVQHAAGTPAAAAASRLSASLGYAATLCVAWMRWGVTCCGAAMRAGHALMGMLMVPQTLRGAQQEQQQQSRRQQQAERSCSSGLAWAPATPALPAGIPYSEADYRAWANAQAAPMARAWLLFQIGAVATLLVKDLVLKDASAALMELKGVCPFISVFLLTVLSLRLFPKWTEVSIAGLTLGRGLVLWLLGLGVLPLTRIPYLILSSPLLVVEEILLSSCFEQVRLTWAALLRIALVFSLKELCTLGKFSRPWLYSALLNTGGMLVAVAIDLHMRRLYMQRMQRQMVQMGLTCAQCTGKRCLKKLTGGGGSGGGGDRDGPCALSVRDSGGGGGGGGAAAAAAAGTGTGMRAMSGAPHQHPE